MLAKTVTNQFTNRHFSCLYLADRVFNFLLDWLVEIYFVDRVLRDYRVQQMVRVETAAAYTLLIFQAEKYIGLSMKFADIGF